MSKDFVRVPSQFNVGDLVRSTDDSNANTLYRVIKVSPVKNPDRWTQWEITIRPIFGLFKSDYKLNKRIGTGNGYKLVTLPDLGYARNQLDLFMREEARRLSGEPDGAHQSSQE